MLMPGDSHLSAARHSDSFFCTYFPKQFQQGVQRRHTLTSAAHVWCTTDGHWRLPEEVFSAMMKYATDGACLQCRVMFNPNDL